MKKGFWGYLGYISWMAALAWVEKKGWEKVRQAVAGRSQDSSSSSGGRSSGEGDNLNGDRESERLTRPTPSLF